MWTDDKPAFIAALNMALKQYSTQRIELGYKKDSEGARMAYHRYRDELDESADNSS